MSSTIIDRFIAAAYVSHQKSDLLEQPASEYVKHIFKIELEKSAGKWKITVETYYKKSDRIRSDFLVMMILKTSE